MANNRIYLKCNVCGDLLFIGKSFLKGYYWENYGRLNGDPDSPPLEDRLNEFFEKHAYCNNEGNDGDYSIEYESPFRDTVEVVRCKDCRYYYRHELSGKPHFTCDIANQYMTGDIIGVGFEPPEDWFCAGGERREDDG